jgi:Fe-S cluster assembly protein SufD
VIVKPLRRKRNEREEDVIATAQLEGYLEAFGEFEKHAAGHTLAWLRELRHAAFARFAEVGFPTTHDEDWRFTNTAPIVNTRFALASPGRVSSQAISAFELPGAACRLVFVDGHFSPELSTFGDLPRGVKVGGLAEVIAKHPDQVEPYLGRFLNIQRDAFSALNTAFAADGAYVHIPRGVVVDNPIYLLFVTTAGQAPTMSHPRNLFIADEQSEVALVEDYVSLGEGTALSNVVTELVAKEGAIVSHYMIEREHKSAFNISTLRIEQEKSANVASHSVLLGGGLVRNNVHPVLDGEGAECLINGLFVGNGRQHLDNYMLVEHGKPHCSSRQFYNGILDERAHGVFHGRIIVHKDAQKTDAKQTNRNLLLSDDAQIDTKPQLEIYADDVKCTHGATIGQIEETALFYLRSRGIDEASARKLLLLAFANECLDRMQQESVRNYVEGLIGQYLVPIAASGEARSGAESEDQGRRWEEIEAR